MKKITLILLLIIISITVIIASPIDSTLAKTVAENFYLRNNSGINLVNSDNLIANLVYKRTESNTNLYYVYNIGNENGWIMVAADNAVMPILAYSFEGNYSSTDQPPAFIEWMNDYKNQILNIKQNNITANNTVVNRWNQLTTNNSNQGQLILSVSPLLSTTWNQGCYYNTYCPSDGSGPCSHALTGCVATAMAQIMNYWQYPTTGFGSHSYTHSTYGTLSANFGATTYNWGSMPNNVSSANSAVATLMYHCGVSVEMDYSPTASGAATADVVDALINYFGYQNTATYVSSSNYTNSDWISLLKLELDASRPVQYRGSGSSGGHSFVCDGYNSSDYFHFNWGWSGSYNGYFAIGSLNPGSYAFNSDNAAVIYIQPPSSNPCSNISTIDGCGSNYSNTYVGIGNGIWYTNTDNPCNFPTPGLEKIYSFVAPTTGIYSIEVTSSDGYVDYLWNANSCSSSGWTCIQDIISPGTYGLMLWTAGTTYYILLDCEDVSTGTHTFYINCPCTIPSAVIVTGGGTFCNSSNLTASGGIGGTIYWQGTTSGGTSTAYPGNTAIPTSSGTYYFRAYNNCGWGPEGSVSVTINTIPTSVSVSGGGTFCNSANLIASGGSGGTIYWQGTTSGGTSTAYPGNTAIPTSSGTYYFRSYNSCGWGPEGSATVTINTIPSAISVSGGGTFCNSANLTASGGSGGTIYWQGTTSGGTSTAYPGNTAIPTSSGTYYFRSYNSCGWGPQGSASVTINTIPTSVSVSGGGTFCNSTTLTATGGSGGTIYWQGNNSNGTSTSTASTSQTVSSSDTYYFRSYNSCGWGPQGSATVIINNIPPTITTQASNQTVECDGAGNSPALNAWLASNGGAVASDNCSGITWSNNFTSLSDLCGATASAVVTFTASDAFGNTSTSSATFTIVDITPPAITTQASNQTVECDGNGNTTALNAWLVSNGGAVASDICSGMVTWSNDFTSLSDLCGSTGSTVVTFTASDACGNTSTSSATFTIVDTIPPLFAALPGPSNINAPAVPSFTQATAVDICGGSATLTFNDVITPGACPGSYSVNRTWTAIDNCGNPSQASQTINVISTVTPSFSPVSAICSGTPLSALPTTSTNGITGSWSPALNNTATTTYTFTPTSGQCANTATLTITVNTLPAIVNVSGGGTFCNSANLTASGGSGGTIYWQGTTSGGTSTAYPGNTAIPTSSGTYYFRSYNSCGWGPQGSATVTINPQITPTFTPVVSYCPGFPLAPLPTTSNNGYTGTWAPALDIYTTTTYTFTPTVGQCANTTTLTITVNPQATPTFTAIGTLCQNSVPPVLPLNSTNVPPITGTWNATINTTNAGTAVYTFTPTAGQCATIATMSINVYTHIVPAFAPYGPFCQNSVPPILPVTSTNVPPITGIWNAAINTTNAGTTVYTFTPAAGQCATTATMSIMVDPKITPTFNPRPAICSGDPLAALPTTSNNGIAGTWSPALNNTNTTTYTFTPTAGICANNTTLTITVNPPATPTFAPVAAICSGTVLSALPTVSNNGINGTWAPALNNLATTTYTFTPTAGQCANSTAIMTITVNSKITPTFAAVAPICSGASLPPLPTTSTNVPPITGSWSPAMNNTTTTTYTFTAAAGQCANTANLTITVNPAITPTFTAIGPLCQYSVAPVLPTSSTNVPHITGTWNPATSTTNASATVYTFTPTAGQCASTTTLSITVNPQIMPTFAAIGPLCQYSVAPVLPLISTNVPPIPGTWSPAISTANAGTTVYTFIPNTGQCASSATLHITVDPAYTPAFVTIGPLCQNSVPPALPLSSTNIPPITGSWNAAISTAVVGTIVYTFTPAAWQCATSTTMGIMVNSIPATPFISLNGLILQSDAASGNQWYNQNGLINGEINQNCSPIIEGDYYTVVTLNGCSSNASNSINVVFTGIELTDNNRIIKIYPNPISDELIIEIEGNKELTNFEIYNSIGQVVLNGSVLEKTIVQTTNLASGVYLIKLENGKTFEFKKIVKE